MDSIEGAGASGADGLDGLRLEKLAASGSEAPASGSSGSGDVGRLGLDAGAAARAEAAASGLAWKWVPSEMISAISSSVSRQAVPLPMATTPTLCLPTSSFRYILASWRRFWGGWGWITPLSRSSPWVPRDRDLAAVPEAGVDRQHDLLGDRRLEQEAPEVPGEHVDGVALGHLGQVATDLALHAGQEQAVEGVEGRGPEKVGLGVGVERELRERRLASRSGR